MSSLIEINDPALAGKDTILIDARAGQDSYQRYLAGHLKGAIFADLDQHLTTKPEDPAFGGRHPLPNIQEFAVQLGNWGVTPQSHVVVYDDKSGAFAASRLWWMLRAIGHENVQVLNGGLQAAKNAGVELSTEAYTPTPVDPYPVTHEYANTVLIDEAGEAAKDPSRVVIDVRETPRYLGQTEPLDLIAGHIPGAHNLPYTNNLGADGRYLPADELRKAYDAVIGDVAHNEVIVHCGSGVTACHTLLGLDYAGIAGAKLYVGSWSEWSRRDLPIGKEER
ncbi:sulfurtransferase [Mucilaginibacter rubeus]|uniref:Sulfurtransferase n=1 Tax=Mucilaginibacter rubeus TaxID=2027860 RepID=A0A5C1HTG5_9SPHI|nr:sulfurtransferase [Mucilaginibacter rubeus]QEM08723.1 sulfurtransferase [Mucilaginibacter rubeus]